MEYSTGYVSNSLIQALDCKVWCISLDIFKMCVAGRSETEVEYNVGFDADGLIQGLDCKVWCLGGAYLDVSFADIAGIMSGLNQVSEVLCSKAACFDHVVCRLSSTS